MTRAVGRYALSADGWFRGLRHVPSPNFDARPAGTAIELIVVHNISLPPGRYGAGHIERLFTNALDPAADPYFVEVAPLRVSAHLLIERTGAPVQFVSCSDRAWHAGVSEFDGRQRCNDFSIGIELEGTDFGPYETAQYETLQRLVDALTAAYPIVALRGHSDIAPGRKTDPGPGFEWQRVRAPSTVSLPRRSA